MCSPCKGGRFKSLRCKSGRTPACEGWKMLPTSFFLNVIFGFRQVVFLDLANHSHNLSLNHVSAHCRGLSALWQWAGCYYYWLKNVGPFFFVVYIPAKRFRWYLFVFFLFRFSLSLRLCVLMASIVCNDWKQPQINQKLHLDLILSFVSRDLQFPVLVGMELCEAIEWGQRAARSLPMKSWHMSQII